MQKSLLNKTVYFLNSKIHFIINDEYDNIVRDDYLISSLGSIIDFINQCPAIPKIFLQILKARKKLHPLAYYLKTKNTRTIDYYGQNLLDY